MRHLVKSTTVVWAHRNQGRVVSYFSRNPLLCSDGQMHIFHKYGTLYFRPNIVWYCLVAFWPQEMRFFLSMTDQTDIRGMEVPRPAQVPKTQCSHRTASATQRNEAKRNELDGRRLDTKIEVLLRWKLGRLSKVLSYPGRCSVSIHHLSCLLYSTLMTPNALLQLCFDNVCRLKSCCTIGDFQVAFCLCFKASPSAKPFIWKLVLFTWKFCSFTCE